MFKEDDVVFRYSRAQAIEDGELVDVSATAKEAGIRFPVALTRAVFESCVALPAGYVGPQDEAGRLWDVVWMASRKMIKLVRRHDDSDICYFELLVVNPATDKHGMRRLKSHCGPGDSAEPVITIMLPDED